MDALRIHRAWQIKKVCYYLQICQFGMIGTVTEVQINYRILSHIGRDNQSVFSAFQL